MPEETKKTEETEETKPVESEAPIEQDISSEDLVPQDVLDDLGITDETKEPAPEPGTKETQAPAGEKPAGPTDIGEMLYGMKESLPAEQYDKLTSQLQELQKAAGAVDILKEDPRAQAAWQAAQAAPAPSAGSQGPTQTAQGAPQQPPIDFALLDRAAEAGTSIGDALQSVLAQFSRTQLAPYLEQMNQASQQQIDAVNRQMQEQQATTLWQNFAAEHPEVETDQQLRQRIADCLQGGRAGNIKDAHALACLDLGRQSGGNGQEPAPSALTTAQKGALAAAGQIGRTGRQAEPGTVTKDAETMDEALEMAFQSAGVRR